MVPQEIIGFSTLLATNHLHLINYYKFLGDV